MATEATLPSFGRNRAPEVESVAAVFLTLTWITSALRCYVRGVMAKSFGIEDWLAMLAQVLFTLTASFALEGISHSMGLHLAEILITSPQDLTPAMMFWFSTELAYTMTTGVLKLSIAFFLLRIATERSHRIVLYAIIIVVSLLTIGYFLFLVFQCSPVSYFWLTFSGATGSCLPPETVGAMTYVHSGVNAGCDVILALLPVVIVSRLQMNIRTKLTVICILSMGIIAAIAVVIRIPYVKILVDNAADFLFNSTDVVIWSAIEPGLAITAANMATLRPLFQAFLSRTKLWGDTTARGKSSGYGQSKSRSRGLSGTGLSNARKGYIRSGKGGDVSMATEMDGKEGLALKDMISPSAQPDNTVGREVDLEAGSNEDQTSNQNMSRGQERRVNGEWPIEVRKTVQVTSWRVENGEDIPVGLRNSTLMMNKSKRQSVVSYMGATPAGW